MPMFRIRREVGDVSQDDMDAAAFRAVICIPQFEGMRWHRSFWDREAGFIDCFYEAADRKQIEEHARVARLACDDVSEVDELLPDTYTHG